MAPTSNAHRAVSTRDAIFLLMLTVILTDRAYIVLTGEWS